MEEGEWIELPSNECSTSTDTKEEDDDELSIAFSGMCYPHEAEVNLEWHDEIDKKKRHECVFKIAVAMFAAKPKLTLENLQEESSLGVFESAKELELGAFQNASDMEDYFNQLEEQKEEIKLDQYSYFANPLEPSAYLDWHGAVDEQRRRECIAQVMRSYLPHDDSDSLLQNAQNLEKEIYESAVDEEDYYAKLEDAMVDLDERPASPMDFPPEPPDDNPQSDHSIMINDEIDNIPDASLASPKDVSQESEKMEQSIHEDPDEEIDIKVVGIHQNEIELQDEMESLLERPTSPTEIPASLLLTDLDDQNDPFNIFKDEKDNLEAAQDSSKDILDISDNVETDIEENSDDEMFQDAVTDLHERPASPMDFTPDDAFDKNLAADEECMPDGVADETDHVLKTLETPMEILKNPYDRSQSDKELIPDSEDDEIDYSKPLKIPKHNRKMKKRRKKAKRKQIGVKRQIKNVAVSPSKDIPDKVECRIDDNYDNENEVSQKNKDEIDHSDMFEESLFVGNLHVLSTSPMVVPPDGGAPDLVIPLEAVERHFPDADETDHSRMLKNKNDNPENAMEIHEAPDDSSQTDEKLDPDSVLDESNHSSMLKGEDDAQKITRPSTPLEISAKVEKRNEQSSDEETEVLRKNLRKKKRSCPPFTRSPSTAKSKRRFKKRILHTDPSSVLKDNIDTVQDSSKDVTNKSGNTDMRIEEYSEYKTVLLEGFKNEQSRKLQEDKEKHLGRQTSLFDVTPGDDGSEENPQTDERNIPECVPDQAEHSSMLKDEKDNLKTRPNSPKNYSQEDRLIRMKKHIEVMKRNFTMRIFETTLLTGISEAPSDNPQADGKLDSDRVETVDETDNSSINIDNVQVSSMNTPDKIRRAKRLDEIVDRISWLQNRSTKFQDEMENFPGPSTSTMESLNASEDNPLADEKHFSESGTDEIDSSKALEDLKYNLKTNKRKRKTKRKQKKVKRQKVSLAQSSSKDIPDKVKWHIDENSDDEVLRKYKTEQSKKLEDVKGKLPARPMSSIDILRDYDLDSDDEHSPDDVADEANHSSMLTKEKDNLITAIVSYKNIPGKIDIVKKNIDENDDDDDIKVLQITQGEKESSSLHIARRRRIPNVKKHIDELSERLTVLEKHCTKLQDGTGNFPGQSPPPIVIVEGPDGNLRADEKNDSIADESNQSNMLKDECNILMTPPILQKYRPIKVELRSSENSDDETMSTTNNKDAELNSTQISFRKISDTSDNADMEIEEYSEDENESPVKIKEEFIEPEDSGIGGSFEPQSFEMDGSRTSFGTSGVACGDWKKEVSDRERSANVTKLILSILPTSEGNLLEGQRATAIFDTAAKMETEAFECVVSKEEYSSKMEDSLEFLKLDRPLPSNVQMPWHKVVIEERRREAILQLIRFALPNFMATLKEQITICTFAILKYLEKEVYEKAMDREQYLCYFEEKRLKADAVPAYCKLSQPHPTRAKHEWHAGVPIEKRKEMVLKLVTSGPFVPINRCSFSERVRTAEKHMYESAVSEEEYFEMVENELSRIKTTMVCPDSISDDNSMWREDVDRHESLRKILEVICPDFENSEVMHDPENKRMVVYLLNEEKKIFENSENLDDYSSRLDKKTQNIKSKMTEFDSMTNPHESDVALDWHSAVGQSARSDCIHKLVRSMMPNLLICKLECLHEQKMSDDCQFARELEKTHYGKAASKSEYDILFYEKAQRITNTRTVFNKHTVEASVAAGWLRASSSPITLNEYLSAFAPLKPIISNDWHRDISVDRRHELIKDLLKAALSDAEPAEIVYPSVRMIDYARDMEKKLFESANSMAHYGDRIDEIIRKTLQEMEDNKQRKLSEQANPSALAPSIVNEETAQKKDDNCHGEEQIPAESGDDGDRNSQAPFAHSINISRTQGSVQ